MNFTGYFTALITPFKEGTIDAEGYQKFIAWQIENGISGIVPVGTTGESPTLTIEEHHQLIDLAVEAAEKRVPVLAGAGSNDTRITIQHCHYAEKAGADAVLLVCPYYNKPSQEGLYQHFKMVHDNTSLPIILYNVPPRTVVDLRAETVLRLAELPRIVGIKDASVDLTRPSITKLGLAKDKTFFQLSGEDGTILPFLAQGGVGCISVTANVAPKLCSEFFKAWQNHDIETAQALNAKLMPLHQILFCETNPGPVKYAASRLGLGLSEEIRLPLIQVDSSNKQRIDDIIAHIRL